MGEYEELDYWAGAVFFMALPFLIVCYLWDILCQLFRGKGKANES